MAVSSRFAELMSSIGRPALDEHLNLYPHSIEIQERVSALGPDGDPDHTSESPVWVTFALAHAKVSAQAGETIELPIGQRVGGEQVDFELLHVAGVKSGMRVLWSGKIYNIEGVTDPGLRGVYSTLNCISRDVADE